MRADFEVYLGDGAYVRVEAGMVCLYTTNGIRRTNEIFLEPAVLQNFEEWLKKIRAARQKPATDESSSAITSG